MTTNEQQQDAEKAACGKSLSTAGLGWIELGTDLQPEDEMCVLCAAPGYERAIIAARFQRSHYDGGGWEWQDECGNEVTPEPTHWMPLPEPPNVKVRGAHD